MQNKGNSGREYAADDMDMFDGGGSGTESQIDIQDYVRIVRKHKWPIVLFTAVMTALSVFYAQTATPIYRSKAILLIEEQKANLVSIEELYGVDSNNADYYLTQFELLKSRGLAQKVIDNLNLMAHPQFRSENSNLAPSANGVDSASSQSLTDQISGLFSGLLVKAGLSTAEEPTTNSVSVSEPTVVTTPVPSVVPSGKLVVTEMPIDQAMTPAGTNNGYMASNSQQALGAMTGSDAERRAVSRFMNLLEILPVRKTKLVQIHFQSPDPVLAANVANAVGEQYITSFLDSKMDMTEKASSWLSERVAALKQTLDESERKVQLFKVENGLIDVNGSVGRLNEQELLLTTTELATARSELASAQDVVRDVQQLKNSAPELLDTVPAVQNDALVRAVKIEQGQRQRELDELRNRYGEKHPKIVDAQSRLLSLNLTLQGHIDRVVSTIEKDFRLIQQRVSSIERNLAAGKQEIQSIGSKRFELDALDREVLTNRDLYTTYFTRLTETRSADGLETANATITERAEVPLNPVKPNKQLIVALAALASLILSMLMAFLYEQLDDTVKGTKDVEEKLGAKLIGILPLLKSKQLKGKTGGPVNPLELVDQNGTFLEAVNTARTVLSVEKGKTNNKVILVTSSVPGEGKSSTSLNLAYAMSQVERVLLIECDLRRPSLAKAIEGANREPGLTNLITKTATPAQCIRRGALGELDILFAGTLPQQPLELISSDRMNNIVHKLKDVYDKIILDCAPTQAVSDALVLSQISDSVVFCVKSHDTELEVIKRSLQRLKQVDAPLAGVLMTQVDMDKLASYGGDYYYQGYYDYYGYSNKEAGGGGKLMLSQAELQEITSDDDTDDLDLAVLGGRNKGFQSHGGEHQKYMTDEFDMTARISGAEGTKRSRVASSNNRSSDLDIL